MNAWILIVFAHVGTMSANDSNSLASVQWFANQQVCEQAGEQAKQMARGTTKVIKFVCVKTGY